jgi:hypothetical protein
MRLSDNQVGDRLHAFMRHWRRSAPRETIRGNTALVAVRQTLSLLRHGVLTAAERDSDQFSTPSNGSR